MKHYRDKNCVLCGRRFSVRIPAEKYCSDACRKIGYAQSARASWMRHYTRKTYDYTCQYCGRRVIPSDRTSNRKYCDQCLATMGAYGRKLLANRKPVQEIYQD